MAMPVETALGYIVTVAVLQRAHAFRNASLPPARGADPDEVLPPIRDFIPQAVEALKRDRDVVMGLLMR